MLKVGGSEITELSGSGHDSSYYDDRSDHERERHKEKKKKKKKKSEKDKDKYVDDEERRRRKVGSQGNISHSAVVASVKSVFIPRLRRKNGRRESENRTNQKQRPQLRQLLYQVPVDQLNLSL